MAYSLRCPSCREKFPWVPTAKMPDFCPLCGEVVASDRGDDVICLPAIRSQATRNNDKLYRDIEKGSEVRAEVAAEHLGVPVSEMSEMKVTNLNDRRDAEIAMMPVNNTVTQHMARTGQTGFATPNPNGPSPGQEFGPITRQGAVLHNGQVVGRNLEPRAGAKANAGIQRLLGR